MTFHHTITHISELILAYYMAYQTHIPRITPHQYSFLIHHISQIILYNMNMAFPSFQEIVSIEILEWQYERVYLLNNGDFAWDDIQNELIHHATKHHHIINNDDTVISIDVVPFDGLTIQHGDILNMLDPILL